MDRAILRTLIYADIFDYALKAWEIHKWLIGKKATLPEVEQGLQRLLHRRKIVEKNGYFVLMGRIRLVRKRIDRQSISLRYLKDAELICKVFKLIPWIQLVGISGNLAMENAEKTDDIDLFVITQKKRLWLSRLCILLVLSLLERRRKKSDTRTQAAGKFCLNLLLESDQLIQERKNLYIAHEVLQMKVLWERNRSYDSFLLGNEWVFRFLPNWVSSRSLVVKKNVAQKENPSRFFSGLENIVRFLQLRYMGLPQKLERVGTVAVYFHPDDNQPRVLKEFEKRSKQVLNSVKR